MCQIKSLFRISKCTESPQWDANEGDTPGIGQDIIVARLSQYHRVLSIDLNERYQFDPEDRAIEFLTHIINGIEISIGIASGARGPVAPHLLQEFGRAIATEDYHP